MECPVYWQNFINHTFERRVPPERVEFVLRRALEEWHGVPFYDGETILGTPKITGVKFEDDKWFEWFLLKWA